MSGRVTGVIGAGAWGTALAQVRARAGDRVILWAHEAAVAEAITARGENPAFLPGVALDRGIVATTDPAALAGLDLVLAVAPAQHLRATLARFAPHLGADATLVLCAKGLEAATLAPMTRVLAETLPQARAAVLSGPSFAAEVAAGLPTAVTLAAGDIDIACDLAERLATPTFRPYASDDPIGAEAGGAVKNVLAIACGIAEGAGLGRSAQAALITRGFAEMTRLAVAMGARAETLAGLCGLGDLVLTCSSAQSRNMRVGLALGRGEPLTQVMADRLTVAEGVASAPAVVALAERLGVETPICAAVRAILADERPVDEAIAALLARPLRAET